MSTDTEQSNQALQSDCYEMIAEAMKTEAGWSVVEHVECMRDLMQRAVFAIGATGANHDLKHEHRDLWVRMRICLDGLAPGNLGLPQLGDAP